MKLAIGTAQFGLDYGVTNRSGKVSSKEVTKILHLAKESEIKILDTASSYGDSEKSLGENTDIIESVVTKLPTIGRDTSIIEESIENSLQKLNKSKLYGVLFHSETDLTSALAARHMKELENYKKLGVVEKIGCSFYTTEVLQFVLDNFEIDVIQIPGSCLDQRFEKSGLLDRAKSQGIEVHCRSLFLQGLLLSPSAQLPRTLVPFSKELKTFFNFADLHQLSYLQLSLLYLIRTKSIDYGVVGCISLEQLTNILDAYSSISRYDKYLDIDSLASSSETLLNPSMWNS